MVVSILHRATGAALSVAGLAILTWWLVAIANGPAAYATVTGVATSPFGLIVLIGVTWSFFQHLFSGMRHLVMDSGAGFAIETNKRFAILTILASVLVTALIWAFLLGVRP